MKKNNRLWALFIIVAMAACVVYIMISLKDIGMYEITRFFPVACGGFWLLSALLSNRVVDPSEIKEFFNEEDFEALEQMESGEKSNLIGWIMIGVPIILLVVTGELHGIFVGMGIFSFFLGILFVVLGTVAENQGRNHLNKKLLELQFTNKKSFVPEKENPASRVCSAIGTVAFIGGIIAFIFFR